MFCFLPKFNKKIISFNCPSLKILSVSVCPQGLAIIFPSSPNLETLDLDFSRAGYYNGIRFDDKKFKVLSDIHPNLKTLLLRNSVLSSLNTSFVIPKVTLKLENDSNIKVEGDSSRFLFPNLQTVSATHLNVEELVDLVRSMREAPNAICQSLKVLGMEGNRLYGNHQNIKRRVVNAD